MSWYLRACLACGGDAHDDPGDPGSAVCILCGRSIPRPETNIENGLQGIESWALSSAALVRHRRIQRATPDRVAVPSMEGSNYV